MGITDVQLRRITHAFDGVPAIRHVGLDVERGERVWLCGANGSGKSTLLRVVATALAPTFGEGTVLGFDLRSDRDEIRARAELLGHGFRLYADLTAAENLRFVCRLYGVPLDRLGPALERVGLDEVPMSAPAASPRACGSGWRWRAACSGTPSSSCSTSPTRASTPTRGLSWTTCSPMPRNVDAPC